MSPLIMGLSLVALGLIGAFFGYRIFRVLLPMFNPTKQFDQSNRDGVTGTPSHASQDSR